jgi:hypothetical protein
MGFSPLTYLLAALVVLSSAANLALGGGWLGALLDPTAGGGAAGNAGGAGGIVLNQEGRPPQKDPLPPNYARDAPSVEELLRNIPAADLRMIERGELPKNR